MTASAKRSASSRAKGLLDALEASFRDALRTPEGTADAGWGPLDRSRSSLKVVGPVGASPTETKKAWQPREVHGSRSRILIRENSCDPW